MMNIKEKDKQLAKAIKEIKENTTVRLTKEQIEENVIEWTTFFRRNLDIFNEDFLGIKISQFQKQRINSWDDNEIQTTIASRGSGKTFDVGLFSLDMALLYSGCQILITSMTLSQSNLIIDEKIDKIFTSEGGRWSSPVLCQLRKDGWIKFKKDENTSAKYVEFDNGSKIFAVNCGDSCRGKRSNVVITDEFVLIKRKDYQEIVAPTLEIRKFGGRPKDYIEDTKEIFLSSAKSKTNWGWKHLVNCVNQHYKNKKIKYGFFIGDIFTSIANGIQTKKQYLQKKHDTDDMSFEQEYLNIFLGTSENSMFKYEDFEECQILENPFYPTTIEQKLYGEPNSYKFTDDEVRILSCDIALATGNENDNTVFILMTINKKTGYRKEEYITAYNGLNTLTQVLLMKRLFYDYKCSYFIVDTKGVGNAVYDILTIETPDEEFGVTYPAWTVCLDKDLQISSDTVINDKVSRTMSQNAVDVIIPYAGSSELNGQIHLAMRKTLRDKNIAFLKDYSEMEGILCEKDKQWITRTSEEKENILLPFLNTKYLIGESISLEVKILENGSIKLSEAKRTDTKDRYMTLAMGNFLAEKIYAKYTKNDNNDDFDESDWNFLAGDYSGY